MSRFGLGFIKGPGVGNDAFTKILLHMDGSNGGTTFIDDNIGASAHTWTAHSATTDTGTFKFGNAALNCGAAVGYIDTPHSSDYALGAGDWTVDFWFNVQGGNGTNRRAFGQNNAAGSALSVIGGLLTTNVFFFQAQIGVSNFIVTGTTAITTAGWHHFAGVRTGNILRMFIDGVQDGSDIAISGTSTDSPDVFAVGRSGALTTAVWNGLIDEFRLSVGIARWTANFTPPTSAYS